MYYFKAFSSILACIAIVKAQTAGFNPFLTPTAGQKIIAGQNFDILWQPSGAPVDATISIKLLQGDTPTTMQLGPNVASRIPSKTGRFTWHVPPSIRDYKTYGFVMYLDGKEEVFQYSFPFDIECLDNNENHPATPPVPKKMPSQIPETRKAPIPNNPDKHHDDDKDDDDKDDDHKDDDHKDDDHKDDDHKDDDHKDDDEHDDKHDDDDGHDDDDYDDDDDHHHGPIPTGVPYPNPKTNNGTYYPGAPKPSAAYPPAAKPSSYAPPTEKPKPEYTSGAQTIAINIFALISGIFISLAF